MTITTGSNPKALWPGIHAWWGVEYGKHPQYWKELFDMTTSDKKYEELVETTGFPLAPVKNEGTSTSYADATQGVVNRATNVAYSLGFICTKEEIADNQYDYVARGRTSSLALSFATTKNTVSSNFYNRAFDTNYAFGDGKPILASDHPVKSGSEQSNILSVAADFSETALEDLTIQIMDAKNSLDLNIMLQLQSLIGPTALTYEFQRVLKSTLQNDTANNATNALKDLGVVPKTVINPFLTDPDAWFCRTNASSGMVGFDRAALEFGVDGDFDTDNVKKKGYERYSFTIGDWRALFGSPGA